MSLVNLIDRNVVKAFNLVKDLAQPATVLLSSKREFNFATGETEEAVQTTIVKMVETKREKRNNGEYVEVMFKKVDVRAFESVTFKGQTYVVDSIIKDDSGFITIVRLYRRLENG